jgi:DNA-directed RNA polymerase specialized sigma24 family protein
VDERADIFEQHRARLCGVAYRMLGSRSAAEDVVQDAYLRWHRTSIADIRSAEAWDARFGLCVRGRACAVLGRRDQTLTLAVAMITCGIASTWRCAHFPAPISPACSAS